MLSNVSGSIDRGIDEFQETSDNFKVGKNSSFWHSIRYKTKFILRKKVLISKYNNISFGSSSRISLHQAIKLTIISKFLSPALGSVAAKKSLQFFFSSATCDCLTDLSLSL